VSEQHDREFIQRFSMILVGLMVFTVAILILAFAIHNALDLSENTARETAKRERLRPVAGVFAGETGRAAAQAQATAIEAAPQAAFDGSMDGAMIYGSVCAVCHDAGVAGAPRMVANDWGERLDKGLALLTSNAINGIGAMPARGGRADLSDEQIEATVSYMLGRLE